MAPAHAVAPPRRGRPPKRLAPDVELRQALIDSARDEFCEAGFYKTHTNRIARRAGLAPGTFYNYFSDKVEVFLAVYEQWLVDEWRSIEALVQSGQHPNSRLAREVTAVVVDLHKRWSQFRAALALLSRTEPKVQAARQAHRQEQIQRVAVLLGKRLGSRLRARIALTLLAFEATCDCLADGEAQALGIDEAQLSNELSTILGGLLNAGA
jgi:AcrR family transcriptional regulator